MDMTEFMVCPCDNCPAKHNLRDSWGYFCEANCNERWHWVSKKQGAQEMIERIWQMARESPTKTFAFDSRERTI